MLLKSLIGAATKARAFNAPKDLNFALSGNWG